MGDDTKLLGGFSISPRLARRMITVVDEIRLENIDRELSHISDEECVLCRRARREGKDAAEPGRTGHSGAA